MRGMTENAWNDKKTRAMTASLVSAIDFNAFALNRGALQWKISIELPMFGA
jgi:hypothetical protein